MCATELQFRTKTKTQNVFSPKNPFVFWSLFTLITHTSVRYYRILPAIHVMRKYKTTLYLSWFDGIFKFIRLRSIYRHTDEKVTRARVCLCVGVYLRRVNCDGEEDRRVAVAWWRGQ